MLYMIQYTKYASDTKNRIKELTWASGGIFLIIAACVMPVTLYFFIVGIAAQQAEALSMGWRTLTLVLVLITMYLVVYFKFRKAVTSNFDMLAEDDKIEYTLETTAEGKLRFTRLTDEESFEISYSEIKKIKHVKTISIIFLKNNKTIDLPIDVDLAALIKNSQ